VTLRIAVRGSTFYLQPERHRQTDRQTDGETTYFGITALSSTLALLVLFIQIIKQRELDDNDDDDRLNYEEVKGR